MERGIEGSRWHHLCCVVFYHWQSSKEGQGLPTRSRDKQAYASKFNLRRVSSKFIIEHNKESRTTSAAPSLKSQESRVKSQLRVKSQDREILRATHSPSLSSVGVYLREVFSWLVPVVPCP